MGIFFRNKNVHNIDESTPEDTRLAFLAADGDEKAFEKLMLKYERFVSTCIYPIVGNADDTMDVSQEVFLKAYRSLSSFRGESGFSTWLYRIAKNCAYDFVRKKKGNNVSLDEQDDEGKTIDLPDTDVKSNPEKSAELKERSEILWAAIGKLSEEHREILVLRDINDHTYEEICDITGIEAGTVKSRIFRAREALKKLLLKENYF